MPSAKPPSEHPRRRSIFIWLKRLVIGVVLLVVTAILTLLVFQAVTSAQAIRRYPPPGQMVDMGGYCLHLQSSGSGSPTVLLDSGAGFYSLCWFAVQPEVAKFTRVVSYDRAGLGWSERGSAERTSKQMVQELYTLLTRAEIPGPYVLVGHSLGGFNMRLFAHEHPSLVAGMVLVDSSHEGEFQNPESRKEFEDFVRLLKLAPLLAPLGAARLFHQPDARVPAAVQAIGSAIGLRTSNVVTGCAEIAAFDTSASQMRGWTLASDLPLAVLSASVIDEPSITEEEKAAKMKVWTELQAELAAQSDNSFHLVVPDSGHGIQVDQPAVVVDAIRRVVQSVRNKTKLVPFLKSKCHCCRVFLLRYLTYLFSAIFSS